MITSTVILIGYAIPGFVLGILLLVLFGGGSFWDVFPLRGLVSDNWSQLSWSGKSHRLSLAHGAAGDCLGGGQFRGHDHADQEQSLSRRSASSMCSLRAPRG